MTEIKGKIMSKKQQIKDEILLKLNDKATQLSQEYVLTAMEIIFNEPVADDMTMDQAVLAIKSCMEEQINDQFKEILEDKDIGDLTAKQIKDSNNIFNHWL